jgi:glycosyltransferase involved in cell wall biosynthesis
MQGSDVIAILPPREGFSPQHFGAIALCVKDFTLNSRYAAQTLVLGGIEGESFNNIPFRALPDKRYRLFGRTRMFSRQCLKVLQELKPKLVEIHNRPVIFNYLARYWNGKMALHLHNDPQDMRGCQTARERSKVLKKAARIYCVSHYIRERFCEGVSGDTSKVVVIYNGLAPGDYQRPKEKKIVFVGRIAPEKGALEFAQALALVLPHYQDWHGVFIGATRHDPNAAITPYERLVMEVIRPVDEQIEFMGFCSHEVVMEELARAEVAVVPSQWNEAFGRTALEAMYAGNAVVSTSFGGLKEVVGDAALTLDNGTPDALADAIERFIKDEKMRKDYQQRARARAVQFNITHCTRALDEERAKIIG